MRTNQSRLAGMPLWMPWLGKRFDAEATVPPERRLP
jgi:hypothetical protein